MVQIQLISKILATQNNNIITDNLITDEYFVGYENEFNFIQEHQKQYGNVPDKATFLAKFPDFELVEVTESDEYLINTIQEEFLYYKSVPIIQKAAKLLSSDSNAAAEYLVNAMKELQPQYNLGGKDIIANAMERYDLYIQRRDNPNGWYFESGFDELDEYIHGIQREEELIVIFARTNQGKSWVLEKMCTHVWECGFNVGYVSPEMSGINVGYRFDTLHNNYRNSDLMWGKDELDAPEYKEYLTDLQQHKNKFIVATPIDFGNVITVTKLKNWIKKYKLDLLAVDGIKYITDERYKRGDNVTTGLTNISEDLMSLSMELKIPVLVVVQSNRGGAMDKDSKGTPELETIRDSDGISHNASKVLSVRQSNHTLEIGIKKQRFGIVNKSVKYNWDINIGDFQYIESPEDEAEKTEEEYKPEETNNVVKMPNRSDVF